MDFAVSDFKQPLPEAPFFTDSYDFSLRFARLNKLFFTQASLLFFFLVNEVTLNKLLKSETLKSSSVPPSSIQPTTNQKKKILLLTSLESNLSLPFIPTGTTLVIQAH